MHLKMKKYTKLLTIIALTSWLLGGGIFIFTDVFGGHLFVIKFYNQMKNGKDFSFEKKYTIPENCFISEKKDHSYGFACIENKNFITATVSNAPIENEEWFTNEFAHENKYKIKHRFLKGYSIYYIPEEKITVISSDNRLAKVFVYEILSK